ncbi:MAG: DNA-protecting protein DprA [Lachnospiraceae bacterium]|nr:DNA-protecting protein DprA [Lachnospiraceae bacterium]
MNEKPQSIQERNDAILGWVLDREIPSAKVGKALIRLQRTKGKAETADLEQQLRVAAAPLKDKARRTLEICSRLQMGMVFLGSPDYPPMLEMIQDPPAILFYRGRREVLTMDAVAVVGSRRATPYGRQAAYDIAAAVSEQGLCVVSGLAVGIDSVAHRGALDRSGATVAVMAGSLEGCYPKRNEWLFKRILETGAAVSEYPPGVPVLKYHFTERNRIVSGMCRSVVVAQAGMRSGSLITAGYAAEQSREVFCVPGSIYEPEYMGSHRLIQDGANILVSVRELLEDNGLSEQCMLSMPAESSHHMESLPLRRQRTSEAKAWEETRRMRGQDNQRQQQAGQWRWLYEAIDDFGSSPEALLRSTGTDPVTLQIGISEMEILGLIRRSGPLITKTR